MIARGLVAGGAKVYITSRRGCEETAAELSAEGIRAIGEQLRAAEPALHVLVHAAGVQHVAPVEDHAAAAWDETWSVNVKSFFRLVQELLPGLRAASSPADPARVIALGSVDGLRVPQMDVYAY